MIFEKKRKKNAKKHIFFVLTIDKKMKVGVYSRYTTNNINQGVIIMNAKEILKAYNQEKGAHCTFTQHEELLNMASARGDKVSILLEWFKNSNYDLDTLLQSFVEMYATEEEPAEVETEPTEEEPAEVEGNAELNAKIKALETQVANLVKAMGIEEPTEEEPAEEPAIKHNKFDRVLRYVKKGKQPFLTGGAGTGKNVLCEQIAHEMGLNFYMTGAVSDEYKLKGFTDAMGIYHETQFYKAFKNGGVFMFDEIDASAPSALIVINDALSSRECDFPTGKDINGNYVGGYVKAHKDFRCICAGNTLGTGGTLRYVGTNSMNMATRNRFVMCRIDYDKRIEEVCARGDMELVNFAEELRKNADEAGMDFIVSYRNIKNIADMLDEDIPLEELLDECLFMGLGADDINTLTATMESSNKYVKASRKLCRR